MSVLLVGADEELGGAVVRRLIEQDDEVRVVENDPSRASLWKSLGAHVARGDASDPDLVEWAAQHVRTIVLFESGEHTLNAVLQGAAAARAERLVLCTTALSAAAARSVDAKAKDYVVLLVPRGRDRWRRRQRIDRLAEAIDAADDLAGNLRVVLDLEAAASWSALGLEGPR